MFQKLSAKNYRGYTDLTLDKLGLVNVFTGLNGTGKSTALEIPFLIGGVGNFSLISTIENIRRNRFGPGSENAFLSMFSNLDSSEQPVLRGEISNGKKFQTYELKLIALQSDSPLPGATQTQSIAGVKMVFQSPARGVHTSTGQWVMELDAKGAQTLKLDTQINMARDFLISGFFHSPYHYFDSQIHRHISELQKEKRVNELVESLLPLEPRLRDLVPILENGVETIYADLGDFTRLHPVSTLGSGFGNMMALMAALAVKPQFLCIDELEDGIHHSVRLDIVRNLVRVAKLRGVQLFITTHSNALLFDLIGAATEHQCDDFKIFRMVRSKKNGALSANAFTLDQAQDALDSDIDLR